MNKHPGVERLELAERFQAVVSRCAPDVDGGRLYRTVAGKYSESHRHYHTLDHIQHCLSQLDKVRELAADPDAIELALWFHDIVYEPSEDDNELQSARLFESLLGEHMPRERAARIHRLIMATVYPSEPEDGDERLMVDIDLSSFALPWEEFMRDTRALRAELAHVPEERFLAGKLRFLETMVSRPRFYLTDYFYDRFESTARSNIERHIRDVRNGT